MCSEPIQMLFQSCRLVTIEDKECHKGTQLAHISNMAVFQLPSFINTTRGEFFATLVTNLLQVLNI